MSELSEVDLAKHIVEYFRDLQHDVHQEVSGRGGRADIVIVLGSIVAVVEVKRSLTFGVIAQALSWQAWAHRVFIGVPTARHSDGRRLAYKTCKSFGVGVIEIAEHTRDGSGAKMIGFPRTNKRADVKWLRNSLCEETRTFAEAGNASSRFWSPFRRTCREVRRALANGPLTTKQLMDVINGVGHHYASDAGARSSLTSWAQDGKIPGVLLDDSARPMLWSLDPAFNEDAA